MMDCNVIKEKKMLQCPLSGIEWKILDHPFGYRKLAS